MYQSGQFDIGSIRKENANIDIGVMTIPHPDGKETAAIIGGWSFIIPKDAKNPEDTKKFIQFLAESDNMGFFTDTFPARKSAMELERFKDPILANFKAMLPHRPPRAGPQELDPDHPGLFRWHPAHPGRRPGGAGGYGSGERGDPGAARSVAAG